ncbi:MAG: hypothetical protein ACRD5Z_10910, partial [Bryobacteraceae bacterium]
MSLQVTDLIWHLNELRVVCPGKLMTLWIMPGTPSAEFVTKAKGPLEGLITRLIHDESDSDTHAF